MNDSVSLDEQYLEVQREIAMRKRMYPQWTDRGTLKPHIADRQMSAMEAVLETVRKARQAEAMTSKTTGKRIDEEAIAAVPALKDRKALVLYFETQADADEFATLIQQVKPGMKAVQI